MYTLRHTLIALLVLGMILGLAAPAAATVTARQDDPVTLHFAEGGFVPITESLDPTDTFSSFIFDNLYLKLVATDLYSGLPVPQLATSWTVSNNRLVWTFTLRDDVPWVRWDRASGEAQIIRYVTAYDAAYGMQRACDATHNNYNPVATLIKGCSELLEQSSDENALVDYEQVGVQALDDTTLEVTLTSPAAYFLSALTLPPGRAVPRDLIETHGADWTAPDTLVTNGAYLVEDWLPGQRLRLVANPWFPADLRGPGNIERVEISVADDTSLQWLMYETHQIDVLRVYDGDDFAALEAFPDELHIRYLLAVHAFLFMLNSPPFDDVHVRRAFAAAYDRQPMLDRLAGLPVVPMIHYTSPGVLGAPPLDRPGIGHDPAYAREQLALAGYPNCEGFPPTQIAVWDFVANWANELVSSLETHLGCDPDLFTVEPLPQGGVFERCDPNGPPENIPGICYLVWIPDFPDAHNYVGTVLGCNGDSWGSWLRPCSEVDDLIAQAATEPDIAARTALYWEIEDRFFGPDGLHPMIPIVMNGVFWAMKPWLTGPIDSDSLGIPSAMHFDWYTIDQEAQRAARGE